MKVSILFSTAYARITVLCAYACSSLLRVGQPRLMPRAEKRVIEYFVSTQILQSILDLLHAAGKTERSELNAYAYAVPNSCSEQFYGGVRKHFAHAQTVYTRPSPFFWEGPGYEAKPIHVHCSTACASTSTGTDIHTCTRT